MSLFAPAWQGKNENRALAFVQKEQDFLTLCEIAEKAPLPQVRSCAIAKIDRIGALIHLSMTEKDASVRQELCERLHDQPEVAGMILDPMASEHTKRQALTLIDDEKLLLEVIQESKSSAIREAAVEKLHSRSALLQAAFFEKSAAFRLTDQTDIASVLMKTQDLKTAKQLLAKITDVRQLLCIARNAVNSQIWMMAASHITDEQEAAKLLADMPIRFLPLLERISSPEILERLEQNTSDEVLLDRILLKQGVYLCRQCRKKSPVTSCICQSCGAENHDYIHKSDIHEYRDYAVGSRWDECSRCGKRINTQTVYDEYLE